MLIQLLLMQHCLDLLALQAWDTLLQLRLHLLPKHDANAGPLYVCAAC